MKTYLTFLLRRW